MRRALAALAVVVIAVITAVLAAPRPTTGEVASGFVGGLLPHPTNRPSAEPGMAVDGGGTIWVSSFTAGALPTVLPGTAVWRSRDDGLSFEFVADPLQVGPTSASLPFAGADSDIGAAPDQNANGFYNVYAASLYPSGNAVTISQDGGKTWVSDPIAGLPGPVDRPWIAADGPCGYYLEYAFSGGWYVNRYDLCAPASSFVGTTPVHGAGVAARSGKLVVDRASGIVYAPLEVCDQPADPGPPLLGEAEGDPSGCTSVPRIAVARSLDKGRTWELKGVAPVPSKAAPIWPVTVATDAAGAVYVAWFDEVDGYVARSSDKGATWAAPVRLGRVGSSVVYPTVAAGAAGVPGVVAVTWYGTDRSGNANDSKIMGKARDKSSAAWRVHVARSFDGARTFRDDVAASSIVHYGLLCTRGSGCAAPGTERTLFDDFAAVITPTGRLVVAHTTDEGGDLSTTFSAWLSETNIPVAPAGVASTVPPPAGPTKQTLPATR